MKYNFRTALIRADIGSPVCFPAVFVAKCKVESNTVCKELLEEKWLLFGVKHGLICL